MSIQIRCSRCGKGYAAKMEFAGKKLKCKKCDAVLQIPNIEIQNKHDGLVGDYEIEEALMEEFTTDQTFAHQDTGTNKAYRASAKEEKHKKNIVADVDNLGAVLGRCCLCNEWRKGKQFDGKVETKKLTHCSSGPGGTLNQYIIETTKKSKFVCLQCAMERTLLEWYMYFVWVFIVPFCVIIGLVGLIAVICVLLTGNDFIDEDALKDFVNENIAIELIILASVYAVIACSMFIFRPKRPIRIDSDIVESNIPVEKKYEDLT